MYQKTIKDRVVGIDISKLTTTYAIVDIRGNILAKDQFPTVDYPDVNDYVAVLSEKLVTFMLENDAIDKVRSVGISAPSGNFKTGCMENSPNMPWKGVIPLAAMLRDRLGLAVAVANDGHVIGLGEQQYGSAHGLSDFAIVTIGHGLGCSVFSNKMPHLGSNGFAGEFGHTCAVDGGRQCECGLKGCLETYVAAKGIILTAKELLEKNPYEQSLLRDCERLTPKIIADYCNLGDNIAIETFRRTGYMLGISLANLAAVIDPEAIILSGGIAKAGKWLLDPLEESFADHLFHNIRDKVKIIVSNINSRDRDVLGASALAWEVKEYSLFK
jgi:glucokinase